MRESTTIGLGRNSRVFCEGLRRRARGELGEPERGAANGEIGRIADGMSAALVQISTIGENVAALRSDFSALKSGKRKPDSGRRIPGEKTVAADMVWGAYCERPGSENTRPTILGAFNYGRTMLIKAGILTIEEFKRILAALRKRKQRMLEREREAKDRERTAAKAENKRTKCAGFDIIPNVKQGIKTAASIALATTCVATAPLRSEGGQRISNTPPSLPWRRLSAA